VAVVKSTNIGATVTPAEVAAASSPVVDRIRRNKSGPRAKEATKLEEILGLRHRRAVIHGNLAKGNVGGGGGRSQVPIHSPEIPSRTLLKGNRGLRIRTDRHGRSGEQETECLTKGGRALFS